MSAYRTEAIASEVDTDYLSWFFDEINEDLRRKGQKDDEPLVDETNRGHNRKSDYDMFVELLVKSFGHVSKDFARYAEDAVSEAIVNMFRLKMKPACVYQYLRKAAYNICVNISKEEKNQEDFKDRSKHSTPTQIQPPCDEVFYDDCENLLNAMSCLPDVDRLILMKKFFEHKKQCLIAQELGMTDASISKSIAKALLKLKQILSDNEHDS
jgi:RNA polymerase sigma factor (sigma-70 family)